jgi:hypothetical protein
MDFGCMVGLRNLARLKKLFLAEQDQFARVNLPSLSSLPSVIWILVGVICNVEICQQPVSAS